MQAKDVKSKINVKAFYEYELNCALKASSGGWAKGGLCPFHADTRAGSFYVNTNTGQFKCFSCQASGGDILCFAMQAWRLGFNDVIKVLKREWAIK